MTETAATRVSAKADPYPESCPGTPADQPRKAAPGRSRESVSVRTWQESRRPDTYQRVHQMAERGLCAAPDPVRDRSCPTCGGTGLRPGLGPFTLTESLTP